MKRIHILLVTVLSWATLAAGAEPAKELSRGEKLAAARKEMLGAIPPTQPGAFEEKKNPEGEYVYEATSAKPIVEGAVCQIEVDKIVQGLTVVKMDGLCGRMPDELRNGGVYWKLGKINPEKYWIGVWYRSGDAANEAAQGAFAPIQIYLNGRMAQLGAHDDPVQVAPGVYFSKVHTAESVKLGPEDEIAVGSNNRYCTVARIILTKKAPELGPYRTATNFGGHQWNPYTALGVNVDAIFRTPDGKEVAYAEGSGSVERRAPNRAALLDADGNAKVDFVFANPLPVPVRVKYDCTVRSYYYEIAAREEGEIMVEPHRRVVKTLQYKWIEGEPAYLAFANLRAANPPPISASRDKGGLGWPEHEVYSFFRGHRHALPWPDPYAYRVLRRLTLAKTDLGLHEVLSLNGAQHWERALTAELEPPMPPPASLQFQKINVPYHEDIAGTDPRQHGAYLRCKVKLPENIAGRSFRLVLPGVQDEATAYVNGQKVGNVRGGSTPLCCDITSAVNPGSNALIVVVRDIIAIMDPAYVDKNNPAGNSAYLDAPGLWGRDVLALFGASIESGPAVSAEEIFAVPSVRKKTVEARLLVGNRTDKPVKALVRATVLDEGKPVLKVGEKEIEIAAAKSVELAFESPWKNPRLWGPTDPHLYALLVEVKDVATGKTIDSRRERFGFRESWIDGPRIMFNGYPIQPKGAGRITRLPPDGDFRWSRNSSGDWSDETGMLGGCRITELVNNMSQHNATSEKFWKSAEENALIAMKHWRNHPSVQAWDLSNEWLCFAAPLVNDIMVPARHFKHLSDALRSADPSRWTLFNGDGDLHGLLDNFSFHYMSPYWDNQGYGMHGHSEYFPDSQFWRPLNRHFKPDEEVPVNPFHADVILKRDKQVIMDNENQWKCGDLMPPGPTQWVGEDDVISSAVDNSSGPIAWMWKTNLDGHRDLGVAPINIYNHHPGVQRGGYLEQTFIIPENQRRAFSGRTETRRYSVLNGKFRTEDLLLGWNLKDQNGKIVQEGALKHTMPSGGNENGEFSFVVPDVAKPTTYTLSATLTANGIFVSQEEWDIEVFPDKPVPAGALRREVVVFDPSGNTAKALERAGVKFNGADNPGTPPGTAGNMVLVIGEDSLNEKNVSKTANLAGFVEKGGRVLVLHQNLAPENLPAITKLDPRQWASQVFNRMPEHPLMEGLDSMDFHFWQPDRVVAKGAYTKPYSGNFVVLADSGGSGGMEQASLMELYRVEGEYVLCQIPVAGLYESEPMARELLARLIRYTSGDKAFARPVGKIAVIPAENSAFLARLTDMDVNCEILGPETVWDGQRPLMLEASAARKATQEQRAEWTARLNAGGKIIVVNAAPDDQEWLSQMAGSKAQIDVPPHRSWDGRGYRRGFPRWTAGLSHLDLYWKRFDGGELAERQAEDPSNMIEPLQDYSVKILGGKELVFPGALTELHAGKGLLLVDQRRWWTNNQGLSAQAFRNLSALLTALEVGIAPVIPPRPLPAKIAYRTVDLTPYANRGLADDVAEDGKGGFTDQGPRCDLRTFPTGPQLFQGIPFMIGREPKVCIVLASQYRPGYDSMPKEVSIPIGYPVEGFFFLHTTAWGGAPTALYTIEYEDGQSIEIPLMAGENIHDWAGPRPFLREKGTQSVTAWTGKNEVFAHVGIFRMLWVNPRPEVPIKRVRFWGPNKNVPVQLGITAAVNAETRVSDTDAAVAKQLLKDALAADAAGKQDEAQSLSREAVSKDPALGDAYRANLDMAEKTHDDEKVLEAAWMWGISSCRATMPWNRIGEILEKRGDKRGALEAYVKSLGIEWNQPPIMDARRRLESQVK